MATHSAPATPVSSLPTIVSDAPTGTWKHPRFDEINRRLNASTFSGRNVQQILYRLPIAITVFLAHNANGILRHYFAIDVSRSMGSDTLWWIRMSIYLAVLLYTFWPLSPLLREPDDLCDIPLTPSQRALLGLRPSSQPATPGEKYITPPKYARSSTPRSASTSLSGSPFSGNGSIGSGIGGTRYSPSPSPLFQKALGRDPSRRYSLGSPTSLSLGRSLNDSTGSLLPSTPSPTGGRGASVGLNSKWLYERGRSSSGLRSVYS